MDIGLTRLFVKVIQNGSFSRAAELMRVPKSTVSKAVARLESETGTKLLIRTTRSLTLTSAGRAFYESCLEPIQKLEEAQKSLYGQDSIIAGMIRITAPEDWGAEVIAPMLADLCQRHPALNFELIYSNTVLDLVTEGIDFAIRIGKLTESRLKMRSLGSVSLVLVASSDYLKKSEKIRSPKDLEHHDCLGMNARNGKQKWELKSAKGTATVHVKCRASTNQMTGLYQLALNGAGVALLPAFLCRVAIAEKKMVEVLPDWQSVGRPVSLLSPQSFTSSARMKIVSDRIFTEFKTALSNL
jgi:LysR family transcriptional regulator for bpeEF and oprC